MYYLISLNVCHTFHFENMTTEFVAGSARKYLEELTSLGPRPTGSQANEIDAVNVLKNSLRLIQDEGNKKGQESPLM